MKIFRDGKDYELTAGELERAYFEQEVIFAKANIEENMEDKLSEKEFENLSGNKEFVNMAASLLIKYQDNGDDYVTALDNSFKNAKSYFI